MLKLDNEFAEKVHKSGVGVTQQGSQEFYDRWATTYDKDVASVNYKAPRMAAEYLADIYPAPTRSQVNIMDIGAGTGLVAKELREKGFTKMDALEPNKVMLNAAKKNNLYNKYYIEYITKDPSNSIKENTYDAVTGCGIYAVDGHVPHDALYETLRIVKPGGYVLLITRTNVLYEGGPYENLEPLMTQLERQGRWRQVKRDIVPNYYMDYDGIVWLYQKL